jgi:hypothetical protein
MPSPQATTKQIRSELTRIPYGQIGNRGRFELFEDFRRLPALNAAIAITNNNDWELNGSGTIATADQEYAATGGLLLSTDTATPAANENAYITPHLDANQSLWAKAGLWGTEDEVHFETVVRTDSIATTHIRAGLFEDAAQPADLATTGTDDNAAFFLFDEDSTTSATKWVCVINVGGTDTVASSGVTVAINTDYKLAIKIDSNRCPHFFINDVEVYMGPAMTDAVDLVPQIAVGTDTTTAEELTIRHVRCSRDLD